MWNTKVKYRSSIGFPNAYHTLPLLWVFGRISLMLYDYFMVWIRPSVDVRTNPWRYGTILTLSACYSVMPSVMIIYAWLWWFVSTFRNYNQILQNVCFTYIYALICDASLVFVSTKPWESMLGIVSTIPWESMLGIVSTIPWESMLGIVSTKPWESMLGIVSTIPWESMLGIVSTIPWESMLIITPYFFSISECRCSTS